MAVPFYRATFHDTLGLRRRRRFILEAASSLTSSRRTSSIPTVLRWLRLGDYPTHFLLSSAGHGRGRCETSWPRSPESRTGSSGLHSMCRSSFRVGPAPGRQRWDCTRAAFLLYEHRVQLEREGVLVLGPNRIFLSYIAEVPPSLGEVAVVQTTLPGLVPEWSVKAEDPTELAALKGDLRMVEVLAKACRLDVLVDSSARREHAVGDCATRHRRGAVARRGSARIRRRGRTSACPLQAIRCEDGGGNSLRAACRGGRRRGCRGRRSRG